MFTISKTLWMFLLFSLLPHLTALTALAGEREAAPASTVRLGVLARRGLEQAVTQWGATAAYLSKTVPGSRFELVPLDFDEVHQAVRGRKVDSVESEEGSGSTFIITLPSGPSPNQNPAKTS